MPSGLVERSMSRREFVDGMFGGKRPSLRDRRSGNTMKAQIAICLLCLMMVCGSLDTLPDPPAVRPSRTQINLVSQLNDHAVISAGNQALTCLACVPQFQAGLFSFRRISEGRGPSFDPEIVRQATDASPPLLS